MSQKGTSRQRSRTEGGSKRKIKKPVCKECRLELDDESRWLYCEKCDEIVCGECLQLSDSLYDIVSQKNKTKQKINCIEIKCSKCREEPSLAKVSSVLTEVQQAQLKLTDSMNQVDNKMKGLEDRLNRSIKDTIKREIEGQVTKRIQSEITQILTRLESREDEIEQNLEKHFDDKLAALNPLDGKDLDTKIENIVRMARTEERERERRKFSFIIYNIPEPIMGTGAEMKAEDKKFLDEFFAHIYDKNQDHLLIDNVIRLGRRQEGRIRPVKVIMGSIQQKFDILKKAAHYDTKSTSKFKDISLAPDKTNKEREEYKRLKEEMARIGDPNMRIRKGKLVKLTSKKKETTDGSSVRTETSGVQTNVDFENRHYSPLGIEINDVQTNECSDSDPNFKSSDDEGSDIFSLDEGKLGHQDSSNSNNNKLEQNTSEPKFSLSQEASLQSCKNNS